jgi:energy-coupling factor transporter ATP-binding protein EcfA2
MKITKISLQNFRAFDAPFDLDLEGGKNLLLYGENGSGKSSIYFALRRFFEERGDDINKHKNRFASGDSNIRIKFKGTHPQLGDFDHDVWWDEVDAHPLTLPKNPSTKPISLELRSVLVEGAHRSGFLDYRTILRTNLLSGPLSRSNKGPSNHATIYGEECDGLEAQLFDLVSLVILAGVPVSITKGTETTIGELMRNVWKNRPGSRHKRVMENANKHAAIFTNAFNSKLTELELNLPKFLDKFDNHQLTVEFKPVSLAWDKKSLTLQGAELIPVITFRGKHIPDYSQILNEARLSTLATCIFFAGTFLSDNDYSNPEHPRFLVLDDAMIGLDLQNRLPIIRILKSKTFEHYQKFLLTHDRYWYQVAKRELDDTWIKAELYETTNEQGGFAPVLLLPSLTDYERAQKYFQRKDYAACANYLRKVCEQELIRIIPEHKQRVEIATGEIVYVQGLQELYVRLIEYFRENQIDTSPYQILETVKATILNPFSHADISSPIYTNELREAFRLAESFQQIRRETVAKAEEEITAKKKDANGIEWQYTIQLKEPLNALSIASNCHFTRCQARPRRLLKDGAVHTLTETDRYLAKLYARYCHCCEVPSATPYEDFKLPDGKSLLEKQQEVFASMEV